ncbi:MAG: sugar ABC transporter substrate-binding protein [Ardenticatenaceae bacterium]|nr:sugar ABC transporter substrate-binding protein [Ardenticatenaceae bacterium]
MRVLKWLSGILLFVIILVGCSGEGKEDTAVSPTSPTPPTIALVMKTLTNPFFVEMEKGARRAEEEFGITLIVKTAAQETSIEQQIEIVDELIQEQVNAIVIAPGDSLELIPVLKKAQDAGIVVINIDNRLNPEYSASLGLTNVPFISVNNEQGAYQSADYISKQVNSPAEAIIIEGIRDAQNAIDRKTGAEQAFAENDNITVVASETANWKIDEGYTVVADLFALYPDISLIFCANDMMALGALRYLEETGRSDVMVAAYDNLNEVQEDLRNGRLAATIDQQAAEQGYLGVQYAIRALNGETLPAETLVDTLLITKESLGEEP